KSTTGRLDIFTRLITETATEFESVPKGYSGPLYLEVVSRTFPVRVRSGMKLNQLRFIRGNPPTSDGRLARLAEKVNLAYDDDASPIDPRIERGLSVSVDLEGNGSSIIAYKAKRAIHPVDLDSAIDLDKVDWYNVGEFWDIVPVSPTKDHTLQPGDFYILASRERIRVPPAYAAEMVPFDPSFGEFRVHYAGFLTLDSDLGLKEGFPGTKRWLKSGRKRFP